MTRAGDLLSSLRQAFRSLVRQPAFFLTSLLILAFGVGANTAIFSVVRTVLLNPLPYADPETLYTVWTRNHELGNDKAAFSAPEFLDYRRLSRSFSNLASIRNYGATWTGDGEARRVATALVSPNYLAMLGLRPVLGRDFSEDEYEYGRHRVIVLTDAFWRARLGADPAVLGRTMVLDDLTHEIIGVLPPVPGEIRSPDIYILGAPSPTEMATRASRYLYVMGRLAPGVRPEQAAEELKSIGARIAEQHPEGRGWEAFAVQARLEYTRDARRPLTALFIAVGLVLLIACANLAALLLVRASARTREFAVRAALGAGRGQILRQMLLEVLTLTTLGGALGLLVAHAALRFIAQTQAVAMPRLEQASLDAWAILFNFGAALLAGLLFGIGPALRTLHIDLAVVLRDESRGSSAGLRQTRGRSFLVAGEVALSTVLLIVAGLLFRTFDNLTRVDPGFDPRGVLTLRTTLPIARYEAPEARASFGQRAIDRLAAAPGIEAAGLTTALPLTGVNWIAGYTLDGAPDGKPEMATYNAISPGYLAAIGARLKSGRDFRPSDTAAAAPVVLISEALERRHFQGRNPLGRLLRMTVADSRFDAEIVGVVRDMKHLGLNDGPRVALYQPHAQNPWPFLGFAIRTQGEPSSMVDVVRAAFREVDPALPVERVQPLGEFVERATAQQRLAMQLFWAFSLMATVLAAVGLYGFLAVAVAQRSREFGIRLALGAQQAQVLRLILSQGLLLTGAGLLIGLLLSPFAAGALEQMLFGVARLDPLTYACCSVLLLVVSLAACLIPAWRACRTDPATALRSE